MVGLLGVRDSRVLSYPGVSRIQGGRLKVCRYSPAKCAKPEQRTYVKNRGATVEDQYDRMVVLPLDRTARPLGMPPARAGDPAPPGGVVVERDRTTGRVEDERSGGEPVVRGLRRAGR